MKPVMDCYGDMLLRLENYRKQGYSDERAFREVLMWCIADIESRLSELCPREYDEEKKESDNID